MEGEFSHYLRCPKCDSTDVRIVEECPVLRRQAGVDTEGTVWFYSEEEVCDEGDSEYLQCFGCLARLPLPEHFDFTT